MDVHVRQVVNIELKKPPAAKNNGKFQATLSLFKVMITRSQERLSFQF